MKALSIYLLFSFAMAVGPLELAGAQGQVAQSASPPAANAGAEQPSASAGQKWYVRDPRTGRCYLRELRMVQQTVPQIIQTEIPEPMFQRTATAVPATATPAPTSYPQTARQPLVRIPILAQQQVLRWPQPLPRAALPTYPTWQRSLFSGVLTGESQYASSAPLGVSVTGSRTALRDSSQLGMPATVLR